MKADFSVVIISYNGKGFLKRCITFLRRSSLIPQKIIVVDDNSSDGTGEMTKRDFPEVVYVRNEKNLGPSAARNRGAKGAEGKYIVFVDNDILVRGDSIGKLLLFLDSHPEAGIAGGKLITEKGTPMRWNMGWDPNFLREIGGKICRFLFRFGLKSLWFRDFSMSFNLNLWDYDRSIEVDWVAESFMAVGTDLFKRLGGFDEKFFMYFEGPDLSSRARKLGYKTYFVHDAVVDILNGHTHLEERNKFFRRSMLRYYLKHYFKLVS